MARGGTNFKGVFPGCTLGRSGQHEVPTLRVYPVKAGGAEAPLAVAVKDDKHLSTSSFHTGDKTDKGRSSRVLG